jgi:predicted RNase H-like HicB family nuclease
MAKVTKKEFIIKTKDGVYKIVVWFDSKDKAYLVKVPSLPDVFTFGKSISDAKRMAKDAIELYCDCLVDEGNIVIDDERRAVGKLPKSHVISVK